MQLGVLGSGEAGRTLAAGFAAAGHAVRLGTRDPDAAREWSQSCGVAVAVLPEPTTMFVAGDDTLAKATVTELLQSVGWAADQVFDLGGIAAARQMEANILFWLAIMRAAGTPTFNIRVVRAG